MKKSTSVYLLLLASLSGVMTAEAKRYYVAPNGDDAATGSMSKPFKTIQKAADIVVPGDTVLIRRGAYRETVTPATSGTEEAPITFRAYRNETVVLSACDPVRKWYRHKGDIWKARVNWDAGKNGVGNTLFVNGALKFEARQGAEKDPLRIKNWGRIPSGGVKSTHFTAPDLKGWGDGYWNGAKVRNHRNDWTISTSTIADYESATGKVTFEKSIGGVSQKHAVGYYIYDTIKALDKPGEWYKDRENGVLYFQCEPNHSPNRLAIEFKRRPYLFNLSDRDHIHLKGLILRGGSIQCNGNSDYNLYSGLKMYAYDKGNVGRSYLPGNHNTIRDCEIFQSWGAVASIGGTGNKLINNYIHDIGYFGTTRVVGMSGTKHLVSHNTVSKISRSFLDGYPYRSVFAYNIFEDGGNLSWDTGFFDGDSGRGNGGGCIVHHNVFRNSNRHGIFASFYAGLDLVIHHNIVYDVGPYSMRIGQLQFLKYYHNTWIGPSPKGNVNAGDFSYQSNFNNNLQTTTDQASSLGVSNRGNYNYKPSDFVNFAQRDFRLAQGSGAIDAGIVLPGINDGFSGAAPDAGALEYGQNMWQVGHNFNKLPYPTYNWRALPGTNMFDNGQFGKKPTGWTEIGTPRWYNGNTWNCMSSGLSSLSNSYQFQPGDGLSRIFGNLKPNTSYTVAAEVRIADQLIETENYDEAQGIPKKGNHRNEKHVTALAEGDWLRYDGIDFGPAGKYNQMEITYTRPHFSQVGKEPNQLEVRIGSPTGTLLGVLEYNPVLRDSWFTVRTSMKETAGNHTLYLLPKGPESTVYQLTSLRFMNTATMPDDKLSLSVRGFDATPITTRIGENMWRKHYEEMTFKTGPNGNQAELILQNNGPYDAYLDRLAFYEAENPTTDALPDSKLEKTDRSWLADFKSITPLYGIKLTASQDHTQLLSNFRVAVYGNNPSLNTPPLWQRDFLTKDNALASGETLIIKARERSIDGVTELRDIDGRFVSIQKLDDNPLKIAKAEILVFNDNDLVLSDAEVSQSQSMWQASFPQIINVGALTLRNVSNENFRKLSNFKVTVWDRDPEAGGTLQWEKAYFRSGSVGRGATFRVTGDEISVDGHTRLASVLARTVRIESFSGQLPLANVSIEDTSIIKPVNNLALYGEATQSKDLYVRARHASEAINSIALPQGDFTSTPHQSQAWWQVALPWADTVDQIVIYNRQDAANRIGNFRVSIWDTAPNSGGREIWGNDYSYSKGDLPAGGSLIINGTDSANGTPLNQLDNAKVVRVQLHGRNILSLAEVQVWTK